MSLTVADLALAIGKDENYVRQHIRRQNLQARKDGRRVIVEEAEAATWAEERGLPFIQAIRTLDLDEESSTRAARMTVLAIQGTDGTSTNVFTLIRHRDSRSLGPWEKEENLNWYSDRVIVENAGETKSLTFYRCDAKMAKCQELVERILQEGKLEIEGQEIRFTLERQPRHHWAYQEEGTPRGKESFNSPFRNSSAEITEYWCFDAEAQERWTATVQTAAEGSEKMAAALHFPINQRLDRVGNLMIAKAQNGIDSEITARQDNRLILRVASRDWTEPPLGAYSATVWADNCGDKAIHRSIEICESETVINHESDVDLIGCEIYRNSDGECIDRYEAILIKEISFQMTVSGPPTELNIHIPRKGYSINRQISSGSTASTFSVTNENNDSLDQAIRQKYRGYIARENDRSAHEDGKYRFRPDQADEAVEHLAQLVRPKPGLQGPIYFVDPHFMAGGESEFEVKVLTAILSEARGQPLYILCGPWESNRRLPYPKVLVAHATIRSFTSAGEPRSRAFHDRYLITPSGETIITNSAKGWDKHGVTFHSNPYEVYRAETEVLWSLNEGANRNGVLVEEVDPW